LIGLGQPSGPLGTDSEKACINARFARQGIRDARGVHQFVDAPIRGAML
jgi:hypothetical protein